MADALSVATAPPVVAPTPAAGPAFTLPSQGAAAATAAPVDKAVNHSSVTRSLAPLRGSKQVEGNLRESQLSETNKKKREKKKDDADRLNRKSAPRRGRSSSVSLRSDSETSVRALMQRQAFVRLCWLCTIR